jgi:hypothetical protein
VFWVVTCVIFVETTSAVMLLCTSNYLCDDRSPTTSFERSLLIATYLTQKYSYKGEHTVLYPRQHFNISLCIRYKIFPSKNGSTDTCVNKNKDQNALKCCVTVTLPILFEITSDNVELNAFSISLLTLLEKAIPVVSPCWIVAVILNNSSWGIFVVVATYTPPKINFKN